MHSASRYFGDNLTSACSRQAAEAGVIPKERVDAPNNPLHEVPTRIWPAIW